MGAGYVCKCDKCDYKLYVLDGVGMAFPYVYRETLADVKSGVYGQEGKEFFEQHPDGAINCVDSRVAQCQSCGEYFTTPSLNLYVPKEGYDPGADASRGRWSVAVPADGVSYVLKDDLRKNYTMAKRFKHKCFCPECGQEGKIIRGFKRKLDEGLIKCPKCEEGVLSTDEMSEILWD